MALADVIQETQTLYPWLPPEVVGVLAENWVETGDKNLAWAETRQTPEYEAAYPGIKRDDGSLRMSEQQYVSNLEAYSQTLTEYGIPTEHFEDRFVQLIENNVDPREFQQRVDNRYVQIASAGEDVRQFYAEQFGTGDISDAALLASSLDPGTSPQVFERQFRASRIGGEAAMAGFNIAAEDALRLADFGLTRQAARQFYQRAQSTLPTLSQLVERHNDPDDDFTLSELENALIFQDPEQMDRLERLFAAEQSTFTQQGNTLANDESGAVAGLKER